MQIRRSVGCVGDSLALVRTEEEQLIVHDRAAESGAKSVAMERGARNSRCVQEELVGIPSGGLVIFIGLAVEIIGAGLGGDGDVCTAVGSLGNVIHRGVHVNFFDGFRWRRGQTLADGVKDGSIGLNLPARFELLVGVEHEAALADGAGG